MTQDIDLPTIFKAVTATLSKNEESLNEVDSYNHDHGTHMVETFKLVQKAVARKKDLPASEQLAYASKVLSQKTNSGSSQFYAKGLENASKQFTGKQVTKDTVGTLINAMMGMEQPAQTSSNAVGGNLLGSLLGNLSGTQQPAQPPASGDLMGSLLSGLTGGGQTQQSSGGGDLLGSLLGGGSGASSTGSGGADLLGSLLGGLGGSSSSSSGSGDLLGSLLTGLAGGGTSQSQQSSGTDLLGSLLSGAGSGTSQSQQSSGTDLLGSLLSGAAGGQQSNSNGIDLNDLLSAGLAYYAAKQHGGSTIQAIMQALSAASPLGQREDRKQSGAMIINTILNLLAK